MKQIRLPVTLFIVGLIYSCQKQESKPEFQSFSKKTFEEVKTWLNSQKKTYTKPQFWIDSLFSALDFNREQ